MHCRYCRAWNSEDDHRCCRCGRRLKPAAARPAPDTYPLATSTAPELQALPKAEPSAMTEPPPRPDFQTSLFRDAAPAPKVIRIPTLTAVRAESPAPRKTSRVTPLGRTVRRPSDMQQRLDFPPGDVDGLGTELQALIYCDAPVAVPTHRILAAAVDFGLVIAALGLFVATFYVAGGEIVLTRKTIPFFLTVAVLLGLFYKLLWALAGGESPGLHAAGLKLVNFDGYPPDREQRLFRLIAGCLSVVAAGLGLVWALVDEESLTWHDHITKTFPTTR